MPTFDEFLDMRLREMRGGPSLMDEEYEPQYEPLPQEGVSFDEFLEMRLGRRQTPPAEPQQAPTQTPAPATPKAPPPGLSFDEFVEFRLNNPTPEMEAQATRELREMSAGMKRGPSFSQSGSDVRYGGDVGELDPVTGLGRALGRGVAQIAEGGGGFLRQLPDIVNPSLAQARRFAAERVDGPVAKAILQPEEMLGKYISEKADEIAEKEFLQPSKSVREGGAFEYKNPRWWLERGGEFVPQLAAQLGAAAVSGGSSLAFALPASAQVSGSTFNDALKTHLDKGMDPEQARALAQGEAVAVGAVSAALQKLSEVGVIGKAALKGRFPKIEGFLGHKIFQNVLAKGARGFTGEGLEESIEEAAQATGQALFRQDPEAFKGLPERMAGAFALGGIAGGGAAATIDGARAQPRSMAEFEAAGGRAQPPPVPQEFRRLESGIGTQLYATKEEQARMVEESMLRDRSYEEDVESEARKQFVLGRRRERLAREEGSDISAGEILSKTQRAPDFNDASDVMAWSERNRVERQELLKSAEEGGGFLSRSAVEKVFGKGHLPKASDRQAFLDKLRIEPKRPARKVLKEEVKIFEEELGRKPTVNEIRDRFNIKSREEARVLLVDDFDALNEPFDRVRAKAKELGVKLPAKVKDARQRVQDAVDAQSAPATEGAPAAEQSIPQAGFEPPRAGQNVSVDTPWPELKRLAKDAGVRYVGVKRQTIIDAINQKSGVEPSSLPSERPVSALAPAPSTPEPPAPGRPIAEAGQPERVATPVESPQPTKQAGAGNVSRETILPRSESEPSRSRATAKGVQFRTEAPPRPSAGETARASTLERGRLVDQVAVDERLQKRRKEAKKGKRLVSERGIINTIDAEFNAPSRIGLEGRFAPFQKPPAGLYQTAPEVARIGQNFSDDVGLRIHELAHHILKKDDSIDLSYPNFVGPAREELIDLDYDRDRGDVEEGFAEYVRILMHDENIAAKQAPEFHKWFTESYLPNSEFQKPMRKVAELIAEYESMTPDERAIADRAVGGEEQGPIDQPIRQRIKSKMESMLDFTKSRFYDRFHYIAKADKRAASDVYRTAMILDGTGLRDAERSITEGIFGVTKRGKKYSEGLVSIFAPLESNQIDYYRWQNFAHARHALEMAEKRPGMNTGMRVEDAEEILDQYAPDSKEYRIMTDVADGLTRWHNGLLDMMVDEGALTAKTRDKIAAFDTYVPLFRAKPRGEKGTRPLASTESGAYPGKRRSGSGLQVKDFIESSIEQAAKFYDAAIRASINRDMAKAWVPAYGGAEGMGEYFAEIPPGQKAQDYSIEKIGTALKKHVDPAQADALNDLLKDADPGELATLFSTDMSAVLGKNVVPLVIDGETKLFQVHPEILKATAPMGKHEAAAFTGILTSASKVMKTGATGINTLFAAPNMVRDYQSYLMQPGEAAARDKFLGPLTAQAMYLQNELYNETKGKYGKRWENIQLWKQAGGDLATRISVDAPGLVDARRRMLQSVKGVKGAKIKAKRAFGVLESIIQSSDVGPRITEFNAVMERDGFRVNSDGRIINTKTEKAEEPEFKTLRDGIYASMESSVNFKRQGLWTRQINQYLPYLTASINGVARQGREFVKFAKGGDRKRQLITWSAGAAFSLTAYSVLRALAGDEYEEQDDWLKNGYWVVSYNGQNYFKIPKAREWDIIPNVVESIMDGIIDRSPERAKETMKHAVLSRVDAVVKNNPLIAASYHQGANKDAFGREIETERDRSVEPRLRYDHGTPALFKWIGGLTNVSPKRLDQAIQDISGGAINRWAKLFTSPSRESIPFVGRFAMEKTYSESLGNFYDSMRENEMKKTTLEREKKPVPKDVSEKAYSDMRTSKVLTTLNEMARTVDAKDERFQTAEKYRIGLTRWATGREASDKYPNPFTSRAELPPDVRSVVDHQIALLVADTKEPSRSSVNYEKDKIAQAAARKMLKDLGLSSSQAVDAIRRHYKFKGRSVPREDLRFAGRL